MKNINLIPRVPFVQKHVLSLAVSVAGLFVVISAVIVAYSYEARFDRAANENTISQLEAQIQFLSKQKAEDPLVKPFTSFTNQVNVLKTSRRNWTPVIEQLTANLPNTARLLTAEAGPNNDQQGQPGAKEQLTVTYEFADFIQSADYILLLQKSDFIENITINYVNRMETTPAPKADPAVAGAAAGQPGNLSGVSAGTDPAKPKTGKTKEDLINELEKQMPATENKSDELLNQLRWSMSQQLLERNFGIKVPDKNFVSPESRKLPPGSAITQEEYDSAKSLYNTLKQQKAPVSPDSPEGNGKVPDEPPVISYQISLQMTLKPAGKEK
ncbi:hypothetical protein [Paenibacillus thalictri]|uniref:Fimbrial assembly protein n=1 Tax=Paenibacillus thalictri TaxID=2527873 RepID=A0A4Q9DTG7_9BACL|nr:hypothetical protein [Paenibacillus thalictri]TBL80226.1 hypothetical protein EYB31_07355 [Paenibacillus thalictri]